LVHDCQSVHSIQELASFLLTLCVAHEEKAVHLGDFKHSLEQVLEGNISWEVERKFLESETWRQNTSASKWRGLRVHRFSDVWKIDFFKTSNETNVGTVFATILSAGGAVSTSASTDLFDLWNS
jgi:hypothetical protein